MNKKDITKPLESDRFIPGIYNYCDRWCERCPQTMRCLNYSMIAKQLGPDAEQYDLTNEIFWQKLAEMLKQTLDMVRATAQEMGIDLDKMIDGPDSDSIGPAAEGTVVHLIVHHAKHYADQVDGWFKSDPCGLEMPPSRPHLRVLDSADQIDTVSVQDAVAVIRWYQHQIHIKLRRALDNADKRFDEIIDEFPSDADGSAKVALIGIDRSLSAWGVLLQRFPHCKADILHLIPLLKNLKNRIESEFPKARNFIRPGFDDK
jgi:hypothetical protein